MYFEKMILETTLIRANSHSLDQLTKGTPTLFRENKYVPELQLE